jgi:nucleotide sugar dehydrogenase
MSNVFEMNDSEFNNSIQSGSLKICIIGIGRIGLPTALSFANSGLSTIGFDINSDLVNMVNQGEFPLKDEPGYPVIFEKVLKEKKFFATTKIEEAVPKSDVIVLSLPTPMDKQNIPNYDALRSVGRQLNEFLSPGSIVIVESTIEPGFIEDEFKFLIEGKDQKLISVKNFGVGVCPETANPGQILNDFERLPRLVGSLDQITHEKIKKIYKHVFTVDLISMPNCKTANAVKLTTNVFRDLNIAFVNELALIFEKSGINIMDVLKAAKTKYNFQVHYPGPGVGGPCLPVNSYQMINFAKRLGFDNFKIVETGRKINEFMPDHVINLLKDAFTEFNKEIQNSTILILGISYKPDVKDIQLTPAEPIISSLKKLGANVKIYDPFYKNEKIFGIETENNLLDILKHTDAMIVITAHKEFHDLEPMFLKSNMQSPIIIDSKCIINQQTADEAGLIYRGIGRGKI